MDLLQKDRVVSAVGDKTLRQSLTSVRRLRYATRVS